MIGIWLGRLPSSIFVSRKFRRRLSSQSPRAGSYFFKGEEGISGGRYSSGFVSSFGPR